MQNFYITAQELTALDPHEVRIVDARASLADGPTGRQMWEAGHIPGAVQADWQEDWGVTRDGVEGMLPEPAEFAAAMSRLGIDNDTLVVAYDDNSLFTASRLAWALLQNGHARVRILEGGYPGWVAAGLPVSTDISDQDQAPREFRAGQPAGLLTEMPEVLELVRSGGTQLVDCRMDGTYFASGGQIPGATRLPSPTILTEDGGLRSSEELVQLATDAGLDPERPAVLYCGGGVSAAAVLMALRNSGFEKLRLFDGSWSQWSTVASNPVQKVAPAPLGAYAPGRVAAGLCFVAGQDPVAADGSVVGEGDIAAQADQVFENLRLCLAAEGLDFSDVVSLTTYVRDISQAGTVSQVRAHFFAQHRPTSTVVGGVDLLDPAWLVEVEAVAALRQGANEDLNATETARS